jgi:predicted amidohydrolase
MIWENPRHNLRRLHLLLSKNVKNTDVIILPEMFSTGFTLNVRDNFGLMKSPVIKWMIDISAEFNAAVCGSLIVKDKNKFYNRFIWAEKNKELKYYDKRHLFAFVNEHLNFTPGNSKILINYKGWRILPLICYDLRFPVWSRNNDDYDLLIYVANWPAKRSYAWKSLLTARAIENQSFVIGVNRVGNDNNGVYHSGDSSVIAPDGKIIFTVSESEIVFTTVLKHTDVKLFRRKFPFLKDRDKFTIL